MRDEKLTNVIEPSLQSPLGLLSIATFRRAMSQAFVGQSLLTQPAIRANKLFLLVLLMNRRPLRQIRHLIALDMLPEN